MSTLKISEMLPAQSVAGSEKVPVIKDGSNVSVTIDEIRGVGGGVNSTIQTALDLKANLNSPTFTGNPQSNAAPLSGDHLTNKTYVDSLVDSLATSPVNLTLLNSAVEYGSGYEVPSYYRTRDNIVHLRGLMKSSATNPIATLPAGFRPANRLLFTTVQAMNSISYGVGRVDILANGDIELRAQTNDYNSLDGISFLADGT